MSQQDELDKIMEAGRRRSRLFSDFTQPAEPKANWFEIYLKKEKQFEQSIKQIDEKMNLIIRALGEFELKFSKKLEYLEDKIDYSNE